MVLTSQRPTSSTPMSTYTRINDMLYVLYKPTENTSVDVLLFHGLQPESARYDEAYWSSWRSLSRAELKSFHDKSEADDMPQCWPEKWLGPELKTGRILSIKYDPSLRQIGEHGRLDMQNLVENLLGDILFSSADLEPKVGEQPIVLVGHSLGCHVIKQFLLYAQNQANMLRNKIERENLKEGESKVRFSTIQKFLDNIKGMFFYSPPFKGSRLADLIMSVPKTTTSPMLEFLKVLSQHAARSNESFREWRGRIPIKTVVESWKTKEWGFNDIVVQQASALLDTDSLFAAQADHFTVIRPISTTDDTYQLLVDFIKSCTGEQE